MVIKKRRNVNPIKNGLIRSGRVTRFLGKPLQFLMGCTFLAISGHMMEYGLFTQLNDLKSIKDKGVQ